MDKKEIIDIKGLPVYLQADVVVCGGGTAGVFAAVAAAKLDRQGCNSHGIETLHL